MAPKAHRGQVMIELLICAFFIAAFFFFAVEMGTQAIRAQAKARFSERGGRK